MDRIIKRGDIYYAELNPVIGSEQGGTRPVRAIGSARQSLLPPLRADQKKENCRHIFVWME